MIVISGVDKIDTESYDEIWYITNNNPNMRLCAKHHKELAPNAATYKLYREDSITLEYLLRIYEDDLKNGKYNHAIENLVNEAYDKWIQLVCYCKDYTLCHRYVLYTYLASIGVNTYLI